MRAALPHLPVVGRVQVEGGEYAGEVGGEGPGDRAEAGGGKVAPEEEVEDVQGLGD